MRLYRIIYDCIEEMESAMKGMLAPKFREVRLGRAECRQVYKISNVGTVIGGHVTSGKITRTRGHPRGARRHRHRGGQSFVPAAASRTT